MQAMPNHAAVRVTELAATSVPVRRLRTPAATANATAITASASAACIGQWSMPHVSSSVGGRPSRYPATMSTA